MCAYVCVRLCVCVCVCVRACVCACICVHVHECFMSVCASLVSVEISVYVCVVYACV